MIFIKFFIYCLYFIWSNQIDLRYTEILSITDVFLTYSWTNAMLLHFSIYVCIILLTMLPLLLSINSETIIRMTYQGFIKRVIKTCVLNSVIFLISLYGVGSLYIIYHLGLSYYISSKVIVPIIISIMIYTFIYLVITLMFVILFLLIRKMIVSLLSIVSISLISTFVLGKLYSSLVIFENIYLGNGLSWLTIIQVVLVLIISLSILLFVLNQILCKKDFIYEDEL